MSFQILLINSGIVLSLLFLCSVIVFFISRVRHDNSVMDIVYGPLFFISTAGAAYLTDSSSPLAAAAIGVIGLWSLRLSAWIFRKNFGKPEDPRYAKWRKQWLEKGRTYFLVRSYLQVNLLQICIILLVALPAIIALSYPDEYLGGFILIGAFVSLCGIIYESVADWQLSTFVAGKKAGTEESDLMTRGLFTYSRRPNYFGESLVWWGLAIMVLPLPFGYLGLISPLLITYIVTLVTGPMLEDSFLERYPEKYQAYIDSTSYFVPWFKKN